MKLRAKDQIAVSAVQADALRPGQEFEVSDAMGAELLAKHPAKFEQLADVAAQEPDAEAEKKPASKKAAKPANKAEAAPPNKTEPEVETKAD